jgi:hypothetical protein
MLEINRSNHSPPSGNEIRIHARRAEPLQSTLLEPFLRISSSAICLDYSDHHRRYGGDDPYRVYASVREMRGVRYVDEDPFMLAE